MHNFENFSKVNEAKLMSDDDVAKMVAKKLGNKKNTDSYDQIAVIKDVLNKSPKQKRLATDKEFIDDVLDILFKKYKFKTKKAFGEEVKLDELNASEKKLVNQMYDKKGNLTPLGKKVMNHGKRVGTREAVEETFDPKHPKVVAARKAHKAGTYNGNVDKNGNAIVHINGKPHTVTKEAFGRANFIQQLKKKGIDVNKMHSNNMKDADAAKKRSAVAKKDLADYRKKTGVTSESKDEKFEPHMMYDPKTGEGKMAKKEADHLKMKKMGWGHDKPKTEATIPDGQTVMTKSNPVKKNDMDKLAKIRKMLDREKKKGFKESVELTEANTLGTIKSILKNVNYTKNAVAYGDEMYFGMKNSNGALRLKKKLVFDDDEMSGLGAGGIKPYDPIISAILGKDEVAYIVIEFNKTPISAKFISAAKAKVMTDSEYRKNSRQIVKDGSVSLKKGFKESVELDEASASVYKDMPKAPGKMISNRVQVKAFKDSNAMGAFLSKQNDNSWQQTGVPGLKSGKYKIDMVKKGGKPSKNFIRVNEEVELDEALSPQQISKMKKQYANTGDRISIEASKKMSAMVKKFGDEELVQLAKADIKWISTSAITALIIKGKAKLLDESLDIDTSLDEAGLWDNIHNKRKEGRPMRKPGSKGAPSKQDFKNASEETDIDEILTPDLAKAVKSSGLKKFKDKHFNVKKTKADLAALKVRLAKMK